MDITNTYVIVSQFNDSEIMDTKIYLSLVDAEKETLVNKTKATTISEWGNNKYDDGYATAY